jgi:hypothetical protein
MGVSTPFQLCLPSACLSAGASGAKPFYPSAPTNSPAPSGRHIPLLTELETLFDFGCYNYAAPDGAENESQRDSNPSSHGWQSVPDGPPAPTQENRSQKSSTLKELLLAHGHQNPLPHRCNSFRVVFPLPVPPA